MVLDSDDPVAFIVVALCVKSKTGVGSMPEVQAHRQLWDEHFRLVIKWSSWQMVHRAIVRYAYLHSVARLTPQDECTGLPGPNDGRYSPVAHTLYTYMPVVWEALEKDCFNSVPVLTAHLVAYLDIFPCCILKAVFSPRSGKESQGPCMPSRTSVWTDETVPPLLTQPLVRIRIGYTALRYSGMSDEERSFANACVDWIGRCATLAELRGVVSAVSDSVVGTGGASETQPLNSKRLRLFFAAVRVRCDLETTERGYLASDVVADLQVRAAAAVTPSSQRTPGTRKTFLHSVTHSVKKRIKATEVTTSKTPMDRSRLTEVRGLQQAEAKQCINDGLHVSITIDHSSSINGMSDTASVGTPPSSFTSLGPDILTRVTRELSTSKDITSLMTTCRLLHGVVVNDVVTSWWIAIDRELDDTCKCPSYSSRRLVTAPSTDGPQECQTKIVRLLTHFTITTPAVVPFFQYWRSDGSGSGDNERKRRFFTHLLRRSRYPCTLEVIAPYSPPEYLMELMRVAVTTHPTALQYTPYCANILYHYGLPVHSQPGSPLDPPRMTDTTALRQTLLHFLMETVKTNGELLEYIPVQWRTYEVCYTAVQSCVDAFIHTPRVHWTLDLWRMVVKKDVTPLMVCLRHSLDDDNDDDNDDDDDNDNNNNDDDDDESEAETMISDSDMIEGVGVSSTTSSDLETPDPLYAQYWFPLEAPMSLISFDDWFLGLYTTKGVSESNDFTDYRDTMYMFPLQLLDESILLHALKYDTRGYLAKECLRHPTRLTSPVIDAILPVYPRALVTFSDAIRATLTEDQYIATVTLDPGLFQYVPLVGRSVRVCMAALDGFPEALDFIPIEQWTYDLCLRAVRQNGQLLASVPVELHLIEDDTSSQGCGLCIAAIQHSPSMVYKLHHLQHIHPYVTSQGLITDWLARLCHDVINASGANLKHIPEQLRTPDVCIKAVATEPTSIQWISPPLYTTAIKLNGFAYLYLPVAYQTPQMRLTALTTSPYLLHALAPEERTNAECLTALRSQYSKQCIDGRDPMLLNFATLLSSVPKAVLDTLTDRVIECAVSVDERAFPYIPDTCIASVMTRLVISEPMKEQQFHRIPDPYKDPPLCAKIFERNVANIQWLPDHERTQERCLKAASQNLALLKSTPPRLTQTVAYGIDVLEYVAQIRNVRMLKSDYKRIKSVWTILQSDTVYGHSAPSVLEQLVIHAVHWAPFLWNLTLEHAKTAGVIVSVLDIISDSKLYLFVECLSHDQLDDTVCDKILAKETSSKAVRLLVKRKGAGLSLPRLALIVAKDTQCFDLMAPSDITDAFCNAVLLVSDHGSDICGKFERGFWERNLDASKYALKLDIRNWRHFPTSLLDGKALQSYMDELYVSTPGGIQIGLLPDKWKTVDRCKQRVSTLSDDPSRVLELHQLLKSIPVRHGPALHTEIDALLSTPSSNVNISHLYLSWRTVERCRHALIQTETDGRNSGEWKFEALHMLSYIPVEFATELQIEVDHLLKLSIDDDPLGIIPWQWRTVEQCKRTLEMMIGDGTRRSRLSQAGQQLIFIDIERVKRVLEQLPLSVTSSGIFWKNAFMSWQLMLADEDGAVYTVYRSILSSLCGIVFADGYTTVAVCNVRIKECTNDADIREVLKHVPTVYLNPVLSALRALRLRQRQRRLLQEVDRVVVRYEYAENESMQTTRINILEHWRTKV